MTKPISPILKPENRAKLIAMGMKKIDSLQSQTLMQARSIIKDTQAFEREVHNKFVAYSKCKK